MTDHEHPQGHTSEPSGEATVVLDIGGDIGALVLHTPPDLAGTEIDIFRAGEHVPAMHTSVRARQLPGGHVHAAVYPAVPAGDYIVPAVGARAALSVTIRGGCVTEATWK